MAMTTYLAKELLKHVLGIAAYSRTDIFLALGTSSPSVSDENSWASELSGNGYSRQLIVFGTADSNRISKNVKEVRFPEATASWGMVTYFGLWTAKTGGKLLEYGQLNFGIGQTVSAGDELRVKLGAISLSFSTVFYTSNYLQKKLIEHVFSKGIAPEFTPPSVHLALTTATPSASANASSLAEPSGGNYARKQWTGSSKWNTPTVSGSHAISTSNGSIVFNQASASWGSLTNCVLTTASSGGEWLFQGSFGSTSIGSGQTPAYNPTELGTRLGDT